MINILPAVIEITTRQESPQPSAVPKVGWEIIVPTTSYQLVKASSDPFEALLIP
jgi:hypothetical protein